MSDIPQQEQHKLEDFTQQQLPSTLNVLTILTIINSVLQIITGFTNYWSVCSSVDDIEKFSSMDDQPEWLQNMMGKSVELVQMQCDHRLTIMIVAISAGILCLIGAIQMRRRVKQGFIFYCIGEFLPSVVNLFILGMGTTVIMVSNIFGLLWAGLWVLLYSFQLRHLTR